MRRLSIMLLLVFSVAACETEEIEPSAVDERGQTNVDVHADAGVDDATTDAGYYDAWNANTDEVLTEDEWSRGWQQEGVFDEWDDDASGFVDRDEFEAALFQSWDLNDDNILDENEWRTATGDWYRDATYGDFSEWDADGNAELTETEFGEGFGNYGHYLDWDADGDGQLTEAEWNEGVFERWDHDDNAELTQGEFDAWTPYWGWV